MEWGLELVQKYDTEIGGIINELMCSSECPCPDTPDKLFWLDRDEDFLNRYGRTKYETSASGYKAFDFSGEGSTVYSKFSDCYSDLISKEAEEISTDTSDIISRVQTKSLQLAIDFADYFELNHECNGMCDSALFYWALDISAGPPQKVCLIDLKDEV